jgi:catechol 2,3-dioxygenase-like lactoylglutathione lyase family enzyme
VKLDHIALQVKDIKAACEWYSGHFSVNVAYFDDSWALLEFDNIKLALVLPNQHKNHVAVEVNPKKYPNLDFKQHRDGSNYHYLQDPWGNCVELINYGPNSGENP